MYQLIEQQVSCPYCGEEITVLVDGSVEQQDYIEDCQVCCRPINVDVSVDNEGSVNVTLSTDND